MIDHWHPVALRHELGKKPLRVTVCGHEIVLFRTTHGVAALDNACPHRGMPLHEGTITDNCLTCPYHGWKWAPDGTGTSPGNPKAKPRATSYDCVESLGAIWVKQHGSTVAFPYTDTSGHTLVGTSHHRAHAPLELVVDNFIEVEHTPSVHLLLGYPQERMNEVETATTVTADSVRVYNHGPQRAVPQALRRVFEIPENPYFVDDWTLRFSPVHAVYDQYFLQGSHGPRKGEALRIAVFFTPVTDRETDLFVFAYTNITRWQQPLWSAVRFPLVMALVKHEVERDCALLARLANSPISLRNRPLGRFDQGLVASRKLIERIYKRSPE
jgi:phenylpropionate dioxygenase-like ring-hydroxylating dioxygenase large terminal subunit